MRRRAPKRTPLHSTRSGLVIAAFYHKSGPFRVMSNRIEVRTKIIKVDEALGLVFGWGFICTEDGAPHHDTQEDHISVEEMFKSTADFMLESRVMDSMHDQVQSGDVVYAMPMSRDVADAFNMELPRDDAGRALEGFMMCVKPHSEAELEKFRDGTYTGFSLEGLAEREPVE